jgi:uncharacterized membrane protein required for colicin V production
MTIWLLVVIMLASLAGLGYRQGAVRVAFSLVGILVGAVLAVPLGRLLRPVAPAVGISNPVLGWVIGPVLVFFLFSIIAKVAAAAVHHKVDVFYKYRAGDLRLALWERLNQRLGLCLGLVNGTLYLILICFAIYPFSYWAVQLSSGDQDNKTVRLLSRLGNDLQSTGFDKVARSIDGFPQNWYDAADLAGIIYYNPLKEARLARYPAFLALSERPEFQDLGNDKDFTQMRLSKAPIHAVFESPKIQAIVSNRELLQQIWTLVTPNFQDLRAFLDTGLSAKFDPERILGRWDFDVNWALNSLRRAKPNMPSKEMQALKAWMRAAYANTTFMAAPAPDFLAVMKNLPGVRLPTGAPTTAPPQTLRGKWKEMDGKRYQLNLSDGGREVELLATVEGDRMVIKEGSLDLAFTRQD